MAETTALLKRHTGNPRIEGSNPSVSASLRRAISGEADYDATFRIVTPEGDKRTLRGLGRLVDGSKPTRLVGVNYDVTSEAEAIAMRELMLREMNHRVKNLFAIIAGMISLAARGAEDPAVMADALRERIAALGRAHSMTVSGEETSERMLGDLVQAGLEPYADHQGIKMEGPEIPVRDGAMSGLALLLHEWATNSVKYGALADKDGTLSIAWRETDAGEVIIDWEEKLSHPRNPAEAKGFGSTLVDVSAKQLGARIDQESDERGYRLSLKLPPTSKAGSPQQS